MDGWRTRGPVFPVATTRPYLEYPMTEAELLDMVTAMCGERGLLWTHTPDSRIVLGDRGVPDLFIAGRYGAMWREVKTEFAELTPGQVRWKWILQAGAQDWAIWRPSMLRSGLIERQLDGIAHDPAEQLGASA